MDGIWLPQEKRKKRYWQNNKVEIWVPFLKLVRCNWTGFLNWSTGSREMLRLGKVKVQSLIMASVFLLKSPEAVWQGAQQTSGALIFLWKEGSEKTHESCGDSYIVREQCQCLEDKKPSQHFPICNSTYTISQFTILLAEVWLLYYWEYNTDQHEYFIWLHNNKQWIITLNFMPPSGSPLLLLCWPHLTTWKCQIIYKQVMSDKMCVTVCLKAYLVIFCFTNHPGSFSWISCFCL